MRRAWPPRRTAAPPPAAALPSAPPVAPPPASLGLYSLSGRTLGSGATATVHHATHSVSHASVAIKILSSTTHAPPAELLAYRALPPHPNIVGLLEHGCIDGKPYLVMEACEGGELFGLVEAHGSVPEAVVARLFTGVVAAVAHMHAHGVAHRDLKLENLLVAEVGGSCVKLCDFGLAHVHVTGAPGRRGADGLGTCQSQELLTRVCGTKSYAAPEILASMPYDGFRADVWSLGVCIFGMVAGFFPLEVARKVDWRFNALYEAQKQGKSSTAAIYAFYSRECPFSSALTSLLDAMLQIAPSRRPSIFEVAASQWIIQAVGGRPMLAQAAAAPLGAPAPAFECGQRSAIARCGCETASCTHRVSIGSHRGTAPPPPNANAEACPSCFAVAAGSSSCCATSCGTSSDPAHPRGEGQTVAMETSDACLDEANDVGDEHEPMDRVAPAANPSSRLAAARAAGAIAAEAVWATAAQAEAEGHTASEHHKRAPQRAEPSRAESPARTTGPIDAAPSATLHAEPSVEPERKRPHYRGAYKRGCRLALTAGAAVANVAGALATAPTGSSPPVPLEQHFKPQPARGQGEAGGKEGRNCALPSRPSVNRLLVRAVASTMQPASF